MMLIVDLSPVLTIMYDRNEVPQSWKSGSNGRLSVPSSMKMRETSTFERNKKICKRGKNEGEKQKRQSSKKSERLLRQKGEK